MPVNTATDWAEEGVKFCRGEAKLTDNTFLKQDNISQKVTYGNMAAWVKDELKEEAGNGVLGRESDLADMKEKLIDIKPEDKVATHFVKRARKNMKFKARIVDVKRTNKLGQSYRVG